MFCCTTLFCYCVVDSAVTSVAVGALQPGLFTTPVPPRVDECAVQVRGALWCATPSPGCVTGLCNYKEGSHGVLIPPQQVRYCAVTVQ